MVCSCISSKGAENLAFIDTTMDVQQYLHILKTNLKRIANKFGFMQENKPRFKFYKDNNPKHRSNTVRMWLLYNCGKVIGTPVQGSNLNRIKNLWV